MRSTQKATILVAVVLLAVLVVWLLNGLYVRYQTTSSLAQEVDHLKATNGALTKQVDDLKATNDALTKEVDYLIATNVAQANCMVKDSKGNTTIQLRDVRKFLDSNDSNETRKVSESFRCNGLSWHLYYKRLSSWWKDLLEVYVCHDMTDFFGYRFGNWSVSGTFDLTMVNHDDMEKSKTRYFSHVLEKNAKNRCYGMEYIGIGELYDGFVKEDAIDFKLQMNGLHLTLNGLYLSLIE